MVQYDSLEAVNRKEDTKKWPREHVFFSVSLGRMGHPPPTPAWDQLMVTQLRYNWFVTLCKFNVWNVLIWYMCILQWFLLTLEEAKRVDLISKIFEKKVAYGELVPKCLTGRKPSWRQRLGYWTFFHRTWAQIGETASEHKELHYKV